MGNTCGQYCAREEGEPSELLTVDNKVSKVILFFISPLLTQYGKSNVTSKQMKRYQRHLNKIIRLQAFFRGSIVRKRIATHMRSANLHMQYMSGSKRVDDNISLSDTMQGQMIEERSDVVFKNGAVYKGQWLGNMKHGFGVQVWPDGARYEGFWKYNKACGRGKFWHVDGDVFEGEWLDDKANGYGVYVHMNGARYEGYWEQDLQHGPGKEVWTDGSRYQGDYN